MCSHLDRAAGSIPPFPSTPLNGQQLPLHPPRRLAHFWLGQNSKVGKPTACDITWTSAASYLCDLSLSVLVGAMEMMTTSSRVVAGLDEIFQLIAAVSLTTSLIVES